MYSQAIQYMEGSETNISRVIILILNVLCMYIIIIHLEVPVDQTRTPCLVNQFLFNTL
jgi:hypothetical protein